MTFEPHIVRLPSVGSTSTEVMRLAREGAPSGTVVWADTQTEGRGRRERLWSSPPGNLYLSVLVRSELPLALSGRLSVGAAVFLARLINSEYGVDIRPKWPNDVRLGGGKLGGILVEAGPLREGTPEWYVVGCGLNVATAPEELGIPTASLAQAGVQATPDDLVGPVVQAIREASRTASDESAWGELRASWPETDDAVGPVTVTCGDKTYQADGIGLDTDGSLIIEREGARWTIQSAEVSIITDP